MNKYINPFEYDAASNLSPEMVVDIFVEDNNYSRFIQSNRNVFLLGERGSGKSMTLLYNSLRYQSIKSSENNSVLGKKFIGIYIPCKTPLTQKNEYLLQQNEYLSAVVSEHFLCATILYSISSALLEFKEQFVESDDNGFRKNLEFILENKLPDCSNLLESIVLFSNREIGKAQKSLINDYTKPVEDSFSFVSTVLPFLELIKGLDFFNGSHFMFLFDDVHDLNPYQRKILNSWMSYRDHSLFSIKVASAKVVEPEYKTLSGGSLLEGHDFILIDLEKPFQNPFSPFGKLAKDIIKKRLNIIGVDVEPDEYFSINKKFKSGLDKSKIEAEKKANLKFKNGTSKQISDYVYKYGRAGYFRNRSSKANRPPYSGLDTIVHISTGVIRNLLEPCYWMFDRAYSIEHEGNQSYIVNKISPKIQTEIILERSERAWERLDEGLDKVVEGCSRSDAVKIYNLFDVLITHFRARLMSSISEPRAIVFTISSYTQKYQDKLGPLLDIARRAQYLYLRQGPSKDDGKRETYYVPNRILMPSRGLDPEGQHARVSLKANDILNATEGVKIPFEDGAQAGKFASSQEDWVSSSE